MASKRCVITAVVLGALVLYVLFWPVSIRPGFWVPQEIPALKGNYKPNTALEDVNYITVTDGTGPEDVIFDAEGHMYAGLEDGRIVRYSLDGEQVGFFADTGGRPLGMEFDAQGNLIVADAYEGLLSVTPDGEVSVLTNQVDGEAIAFAEGVAIAADGMIYFTEASHVFTYDKHDLEELEHQPNGRLLAYDPDTDITHVMVAELYYPSGVVVSPDQTFLLVVESGNYSVRRIGLSGAHRGLNEVFIDNLPGIPHGITTNGEDTFWLTLVEGPETRQFLDQMSSEPYAREILARLPKFLRPSHINGGYVYGLDMEGNVVCSLQDPSGVAYAEITAAVEHDGMLYLGSQTEESIAYLAVP
ncbi:MAG: SMP-30/gluconolactonase/LRE family protein [Anaerolineales bacterium]|nr:SMP-30/gluconolactonase/LRE family protein [Anaerolineales bacterium]